MGTGRSNRSRGWSHQLERLSLDSTLAKPENRLRFYAEAKEFLAKHLGGRFEP